MTPGDNKQPDSWSSVVRRAVSIIFGGVYLYLVSAGYAEITQSSFPLALLIISAGAVAEMLILSQLATRLYHSSRGEKRFSLSSLMLTVTGLSIYMAFIGRLVQSLPDRPDGVPPMSLLISMVIMFAILVFLFVTMSTIVLMFFTEALVWFGIQATKVIRSRSKPTSR